MQEQIFPYTKKAKQIRKLAPFVLGFFVLVLGILGIVNKLETQEWMLVSLIAVIFLFLIFKDYQKKKTNAFTEGLRLRPKDITLAEIGQPIRWKAIKAIEFKKGLTNSYILIEFHDYKAVLQEIPWHSRPRLRRKPLKPGSHVRVELDEFMGNSKELFEEIQRYFKKGGASKKSSK